MTWYTLQGTECNKADQSNIIVQIELELICKALNREPDGFYVDKLRNQYDRFGPVTDTEILRWLQQFQIIQM